MTCWNGTSFRTRGRTSLHFPLCKTEPEIFLRRRESCHTCRSCSCMTSTARCRLSLHRAHIFGGHGERDGTAACPSALSRNTQLARIVQNTRKCARILLPKKVWMPSVRVLQNIWRVLSRTGTEPAGWKLLLRPLRWH